MSWYPQLGLPSDWWGALMWVYPEHQRAHALDKGETVNLMKAAMVTADRLVTVSSNYAYEITTAEGGCGLESVLLSRQPQLNGIVNGIDLDEWNPAADPHLPAPYDARDLSGKAACKAALQRELGLPERPDVPLVGFIGRLDWQKGPELIQAAIERLMGQDIQMVMLGAGRPDLESFLQARVALSETGSERGAVKPLSESALKVCRSPKGKGGLSRGASERGLACAGARRARR